MATLLIVDDDVLFCEALSTTLEGEGYRVLVAHTLARARELLKKHTVAIVFIDILLPDGNGLDLMAGLALLPEPPEAIIVTAQGDPQGAENAITSGAWDYVQKPADMGDIVLMVQRAVQAHERKKQMPDPAGSAGIVANNRAMRLTLLQMFEAAQVDAPVLITGETGTGKELVARAVHKNSRRSQGPFVVVDCSAIAPTLLESELFGNVRGAFTGAMSRQGLAMQANGGTLFLDEVGELAPEQQKVFLRLLQERRFRPIGSNEELESDFRVVAATNRNLTEMAAGGTFRSDLLFRLQGLIIEIPPLRNRGKDVFLLVQYALNRTLAQYNLKSKVFSSDALQALASYPWPGNVRELMHAVEASVLAAHSEPLILMQHLPIHMRAQAVRTRVQEHSPSASYRQVDGLPPSLNPAPPGDDRAGPPKFIVPGAPVISSTFTPQPPPSLLAARPVGASQSSETAMRSFVAAPVDMPSRIPSPVPLSASFPEQSLSPPQTEVPAETGQMQITLAPDQAHMQAHAQTQTLENDALPAESPARSASQDPLGWKEFQDTILYEHRRQYLLGLLAWAQGNVPEAAKAAGLSRQRLYTLLKEHGISRQWEK